VEWIVLILKPLLVIELQRRTGSAVYNSLGSKAMAAGIRRLLLLASYLSCTASKELICGVDSSDSKTSTNF
jgi:hypothetical protein